MLNPYIIIQAYTQGYFPMAHPEEGNDIFWHLPERRGIIPLDERFKVSKNLSRLYRSGKFYFTKNTAFDEVIRACSEREHTWISEHIIETYTALHDMGFAHSYEVWKEERLAGGLYGISMGRAFFGESMFFKVSNASKLALIYLVDDMRLQGKELLDTQYLNEHIEQFGAYEVGHNEYLKLLQKALKD